VLLPGAAERTTRDPKLFEILKFAI